MLGLVPVSMYVGSNTFALYALNARTGAPLWSQRVGNCTNPPVVVNGVLYVGSVYSGGVFAFALKK